MEQKPSVHSLHKRAIYLVTGAIAAVLGFVLVVAVFGFGVWVGQQRANFSFQWAQNYHRNFGGPVLMGPLNNFPDQDFISGHGTFGPVLQIDGSTIIIEDQNNKEETVETSQDTIVMNGVVPTDVSHIQTGDQIVVIGEPSAQGTIDAKFIRILPAPPLPPSSFLPYQLCT